MSLASAILAAPNLYSLKGLVTKYTPHWFHLFVYKFVYGNPNAGKPGVGPFPTFLKREIAPGELRRFMAQNGLQDEFMQLYESAMVRGLKSKSRVLHALHASLLFFLTRCLSFGRYDGSKTDFRLLYRKGAS